MAISETPNYVTRDGLKEELNDFSLKLFNYLDKRFDEVNTRIDALDDKYDKLLTTLDAFLKRLDDLEKDNLARDNEMARMRRWIETIAQKTGVKLEY
jgi:hypothetical protein